MAAVEIDYSLMRDVANAVRDEECILFLGSGVHAGPGADPRFLYPADHRPLAADRLAERLASKISLDAEYPQESKRDLRRMSLFFEIEKKSRSALVDEIREAVHTLKQPSPILRALAELPFQLIATTNYDRLFERALALAGKEPQVAIYSPTRTEVRDIRSYSAAEPFMLKIHGDIQRPESIVVTDEDYIDFVLRMADKEPFNPIPPAFGFFFRMWKTLFIGYSLVDYNLRLLFRTIRWTGDKANIAESFSVDFMPDPLIRDVYETQKRWVQFLVDDVWRFVPELYKLVMEKEMPDYRN